MLTNILGCRDLLNSLSFSCKTSYYKSKNNISVEIYESTLSDEELYEKARKIYVVKKEKQNKQVDNIKKSFSQHVEELVK